MEFRDWTTGVPFAATFGVPERPLMVMSTRANFHGPLGREFVVSYTLWLFAWHQDQLTESDIEKAIDQCLFESWLRIVPDPQDVPIPRQSIRKPPRIDWTSHGLALAKKIFGDKHVA